jgi:hypothetical protein
VFISANHYLYINIDILKYIYLQTIISLHIFIEKINILLEN